MRLNLRSRCWFGKPVSGGRQIRHSEINIASYDLSEFRPHWFVFSRIDKIWPTERGTGSFRLSLEHGFAFLHRLPKRSQQLAMFRSFFGIYELWKRTLSGLVLTRARISETRSSAILVARARKCHGMMHVNDNSSVMNNYLFLSWTREIYSAVEENELRYILRATRFWNSSELRSSFSPILECRN